MTIDLIQQFEYSNKFISSLFVDNSFVFSTDLGLLIVDIQSDLFRSSADYKVLRSSLPYSKEKPFEDKNFKYIKYQGPVVCREHNLTTLPDSHNWNITYMGNNSNIVFVEKNCDTWIEKFSNIPQSWFLSIMKRFSIDQNSFKLHKIENRILNYCREKEKELQIKNFVFTHILEYENETAVYGTVCCHANDLLTFWLTKSGKSVFSVEFKFHNTPVKYIKWFKITNKLFWLMVFLTNGQIYVHEICDYPHIQHTFVLWSEDDFACVQNILVESISNEQCLIFITKMSFLLVILYSLTDQHILSTKTVMIPQASFIPGFSYLREKQMLIIVTDVGKFICLNFFMINSQVNYSIEIINNNFSEEMQNFTCTSAVFSKNQCTCVLTFENNVNRYSKYDGHLKNKLLFCTIPENLVELEKKILSVDNYNDVIDCIEILRINKIKNTSNKLYLLDRHLLDKCPIQNLKLIYWKIVFKSTKTEHDEKVLQELQMILHLRHLINHLSNKEDTMSNAEQFYCRIMARYYVDRLHVDYAQVTSDVLRLLSLFKNVKHTYSCSTCLRSISSFVDFRMFHCENKHKELRCPFTLGPLGMPCLVCSMCFTMANVKAKNQNCVWCFGKYIPNKLLL